jgi:hypothetical protein
VSNPISREKVVIVIIKRPRWSNQNRDEWDADSVINSCDRSEHSHSNQNPMSSAESSTRLWQSSWWWSGEGKKEDPSGQLIGVCVIEKCSSGSSCRELHTGICSTGSVGGLLTNYYFLPLAHSTEYRLYEMLSTAK